MIEVHLQEVSITHMGFALLLRPAKSQRVVPIFIGPLETYSISSVLEQKSSERPLTHDLTRDMLILTNHSIEKVHVDDFREGIFYAHIFLKDDRESGIIKEIESMTVIELNELVEALKEKFGVSAAPVAAGPAAGGDAAAGAAAFAAAATFIPPSMCQ